MTWLSNVFASRAKQPRPNRPLRFEALEPRVVMSAAGLVDVGTQPDGGLSGKITYIHGGHGYTTFMGPNPDFWSFQRGATNGMVEDLGNQEQMTALADYLFRAGATVVPMRPIGYQPAQYVLDNDDVGVTFSGAWSNSSSATYFGSAGDVPYRYAATALTETAYARYRPTIAAAGFYPVYAWTLAGSDRASDQLYRVNHSGGITEVTVNHRRVGGGLVYLGAYYFEAGSSGYVDVSNRSSETGRVAIADMIRFGNGMGDIDRGQGISGKTREDEPALYWIKWHVDRSQGIATSEYSSGGDDEDATVAASPKYAEFMNRQQDGSLSDRLLISFHSNAGGGRGVTVLHNTNAGGTTPNQLMLAQTLGTEINADMVAQNGQFENNWNNRGSNVTYQATFNYGELNNAYINNEFDATIIEVAFHDNLLDAQLMRDPKVRDALARSTYQGMVKYFRAVDGNTTPLTMLPGQVTQVRAEAVADGSATITWSIPAANSYNGDAPIGYRIYGSTNGYGFDGGTYVAGGATTAFTMTGLDPAAGAYFFKVVAVNGGGEGAASEVVAVNPKVAPVDKKVLIVNGFDRFDRTGNPTQTYNGSTIDRVRPRYNNSFDYAVQVASALRANAPGLTVSTTSNEFVVNGAVNLTDYDAVFWILGEESTANKTFDATEQAKVSAYLASGGKLFLSGSEIGWDLDASGNGASFYNNVLKADYVADDANTYNAAGAAGSIFAGLSVTFDNGAQFYNVEFPDRISPLGGATSALTYATGGSAGIQFTDAGAGAQLVMLAFPFETITSAATRNSVMARVIDYFSLLMPPEPVADFDGDGFVGGADFLAWQRGFGSATPVLADGDANGDGAVDAADLAAWQTQFGGPSPGVAAGATDAAVAELLASEEAASATISTGDLNAIAGFGANVAETLTTRRAGRSPSDGRRHSTDEPNSRTATLAAHRLWSSPRRAEVSAWVVLAGGDAKCEEAATAAAFEQLDREFSASRH
ncbi:MAG: N-acetylmuramoyl-L-alanine amidase [Planctomycetaceae bacterium]|nr:N-acetylmuramoyl-L-alanine amidase [Planctomycetaceae bacterium]